MTAVVSPAACLPSADRLLSSRSPTYSSASVLTKGGRLELGGIGRRPAVSPFCKTRARVALDFLGVP